MEMRFLDTASFAFKIVLRICELNLMLEVILSTLRGDQPILLVLGLGVGDCGFNVLAVESNRKLLLPDVFIFPMDAVDMRLMFFVSNSKLFRDFDLLWSGSA